MKKSKAVVTRTAADLAKALGLAPVDGAEMELRSDLNSKIAEVVGKKGLTHAQVARLAGTSRTRVTAIINRNTKDVSTDLLLRVLYAVGYTAKITFERNDGGCVRCRNDGAGALIIAGTVQRVGRRR
jgi:predicted XRE-type DNA-binding protein